jgi:predicted ester cyclase
MLTRLDAMKARLNELTEEERGLLVDQLRGNGGGSTAHHASGAGDKRTEQFAMFYRYFDEQIEDEKLPAFAAKLSPAERARLFELVLPPAGALQLRRRSPSEEQRRHENVELTKRYVAEQQARNYVLPENSTRMTEEEKNRLFDEIVLNRVAESDEELRRQNVAIFYRYIECENTRDYENMKKLFHPTDFCSKTYFGNDPISPEAHVRMLKGLFRSFPDWYMVINEIIAADEQATVGLITGRGTQHEEFFGRLPADHQIAIPTLHAIRVRNGVIVEHRHINPFEDIFAAQAMAPLTSDVMAVRAQQGFDSGLAQRAYDEALAAGASEGQLVGLRELVKNKARQCQVLLKGTLRRCAMIAEPGELYCRHHMHHGYGIDGIE